VVVVLVLMLMLMLVLMLLLLVVRIRSLGGRRGLVGLAMLRRHRQVASHGYQLMGV
jgi:hypothetical protein